MLLRWGRLRFWRTRPARVLADALVKDERLRVELLLERRVIIRFADVRRADKPHGRPLAPRNSESARGDLELDRVVVRIGDAQVRRGRRLGIVGRGFRS